jgi:predicted enzyme related to lactoylglutathione lyase
MIQIEAIHHYALSVKNLDETINWYGEVFGFTLERRFGFPELKTEIAHITLPVGIRIELLYTKNSSPSPDLGKDAFGAIANQGSKHIGLQVENVTQAAEELKSKGVHVLHDVTRVEEAGVTNFWILDNEGNHIELVQPIKSK